MMNYFGIAILFVMNLMNLLQAIDSKPMMSRVYGNQYTQGVADTQPAGQIGKLVPTGIFGTNGSLSLAGQVANAQAVATYVLPNGIIAVVFNDGTNTYMVEYTAEGAVYTGFATGTSNKLTISGFADAALSITIDEQQRFLISGQSDSSSRPWIKRVNTDGTIDSTFTFTDGASWGTSGQINVVSLQTSGKVIAVGFNGTNAMAARYDLDGALDTSFSVNGYVVFDNTDSFPLSTYAFTNIYVDALDNIYLAYCNSTPSVYVTRLTSDGFVDLGWNSGTSVNMSYLNGSSMLTQQLRMVIDAADDLVVAVPSGSPKVIKAASIQSATGAAGSFANFQTSGGVFGTDSYILNNMATTSDGYVYFVGSDTTTIKSMIARVSYTGALDSTFNSLATPGVNFFYPSGSQPSDFAMVNSMFLAPDGQIFAAGAQLNSGTTTAYLSCLYSNQYVYQLSQYPQSQEQGTQDSAFGNGYTETYPGVVCPFVGLYRSSMQQQAQTVIELLSGKILVGTSGYTGLNDYTSMILIRLTAAGTYDSSFGSGGKLVLDNSEDPAITSEYITSILEDGDQNIYVTGYSSYGAIFRKYDSSGTLLWNSDYQVADYQGQGVGYEGDDRVLLFLSGPSSTGQINAYYIIDGQIDLRFNADNTPGYVLTDAFGLNIGALYNGVVADDGTIIIGYKNTVTGNIDVTALFNPGSEVPWSRTNVFGTNLVAADNVRVSFNADGNVAVVAALNGNYLVSVLNVLTGVPTPIYSSPLIITAGTSVQLRQLIGVSDNTLMIIGYDDTTDDAMLVLRVAANATLDTTFNSQGPVPGILSIQIGDQISDYYARVGTGITVQSHIGINQGNLVMSGYEQLFSNDATPTILRIFGTPGTTQVKNSPVRTRIPGEFDPSYDGDGIAETAVPDLPGLLNQEVRAIRQLTGTNIMTVITDNNTSISYTMRLLEDSTIDTTYGGGNGIAIAKLAGTEVVQTMVFDGAGNFLVTGANSEFGGFIKRILPNGQMDPSFGGVSSPSGTVYGALDAINACQQLTNGNIVVVGSIGGVGAIRMLTSAGSVVSNFGIGGQVYIGLNVSSVSVDSHNNIYASVAYFDGSFTMQAGIIKLNSQGQRVTSFGVNGFAASALSEIDDVQSLRFAFDAQGRMCIAGSFGGVDGQLSVNRLTANGGVDTTFNDGSQLDIEFLVNPTGIVVTSLVSLENNKTLVAGYQTSSTPDDNYEFVACINQEGQRDHSFGVGGLDGLVTFQVLPSQIARHLCNMNIQTNGNILLCGGEIPSINQETPLTMRMYGYPNVQAVPQFTGYQPTSDLPIVLDPGFNGTGISSTETIDQLVIFGSSAIDGLGRTLVSGITEAGQFVVARYLPTGQVDPTFGTDGIGSTIVAMPGVLGGHVAVDGVNRVYVSGVLLSNRLVVARFTSDGQLDTADYGIAGIALSLSISNLSTGGYVTINSVGRAIVSGYTSDGNLVAGRFLTDGSIDTSFGLSLYHYIVSVPVSGLLSNGGVVTDTFNNIYLGGRATTSMVAAKLDNDGTVDTGYGTSGVATTGTIVGLFQGGSIAITGPNKIVLGGLTNNHTFVAARFTLAGALDTDFDGNGIAFSDPVNVLNQFGSVTVDSLNNIVLSGVALNYQQPLSMIAARFTPAGILDTQFTSVGMATTGPISGLLTGGTVVTNVYDEILIAGMTDLPGFVVAEMYSGYEIFVVDPAQLDPQDLRVYYYGNNPAYLNQLVSLNFLARVITNTLVKASVLSVVQDIINEYGIIYGPQPGWNLVWSFYRNIPSFQIAQADLDELYPGFADQIDAFFSLLERRALGMEFSSY